MKFGGCELHIVRDGTFWLDGGAMFGIVPKPLWSRVIKPDDRNRIKLSTNCLLVRSSSGTFVIETGIGADYSEKQRDIYKFDFSERLLENLSSHGVGPEDIDVVIQTHLHFDHCGSLVMRSNSGAYAPTFPRAELIVQKGEWQAALKPDARSRPSYFPPEFYKAIETAGLLHLVEGRVSVAPDICVRELGGHTAHHQVVEVSAGDSRFVYLGDFMPTSRHAKIPYIMGYDMFPITTVEHKLGFIPEAIRGNWILLFGHDVDTPLGRIVDRNGRPVVEALDEKSEMFL